MNKKTISKAEVGWVVASRLKGKSNWSDAALRRLIQQKGKFMTTHENDMLK